MEFLRVPQECIKKLKRKNKRIPLMTECCTPKLTHSIILKPAMTPIKMPILSKKSIPIPFLNTSSVSKDIPFNQMNAKSRGKYMRLLSQDSYFYDKMILEKEQLLKSNKPTPLLELAERVTFDRTIYNTLLTFSKKKEESKKRVPGIVSCLLNYAGKPKHQRYVST